MLWNVRKELKSRRSLTNEATRPTDIHPSIFFLHFILVSVVVGPEEPNWKAYWQFVPIRKKKKKQ